MTIRVHRATTLTWRGSYYTWPAVRSTRRLRVPNRPLIAFRKAWREATLEETWHRT